MSIPQSYIDTSIEESEELLALLEASMDADQPLINQNMTQNEGLRGRINREYVDVTIENVIRSERFPHRTKVDEVVARQSNFEDIQQNCGWQHDLKNQKDEIRRTMLFGLREEFSAVKKGCVKIRCRIKWCIFRMISWMKYVLFSHSMTQTLKRAIINKVNRRCQLVSLRIVAKLCRCLISCKSSHLIRNKLEFSALFDHTSNARLNFIKTQV